MMRFVITYKDWRDNIKAVRIAVVGQGSALDVTDSKLVANFVATVEMRFGRVGICVTNSGGPPSNSFKGTKLEDWRAAFDQLLMSTVILPGKICRACRRTSGDG